MKRIAVALVCLALAVPGVAMAQSPLATVQEMAEAIEAHLYWHTFSDMPSDEVAALAVEQGGYDFIGRQNQDGSIRYLLGSLKPGAAKPEMKGYAETPSGLWNPSPDGEYMLMQPGVVAEFVPTPVGELYSKCAWGTGGLEALRDARKRGVSFVEPPPPFAAVGMHKPHRYDTEYIPLDEATIRQFKGDKMVKNPEGYEYAISYTLGEKNKSGDNKYTRTKLPASLLRLVVEKCGYEPPVKLTKATPIKAVLTVRDGDGVMQHAQTLEDAESLKELVKILRSMKPYMMGKCNYAGALVLTYEDGTERSFYKGMDGCGTIIMGTGAARRLSQKADKAFWTLFAETREATMPKVDDQ